MGFVLINRLIRHVFPKYFKGPVRYTHIFKIVICTLSGKFNYFYLSKILCMTDVVSDFLILDVVIFSSILPYDGLVKMLVTSHLFQCGLVNNEMCMCYVSNIYLYYVFLGLQLNF